MAGVYLHIPFCRKICGYCDFFKNISLKQKDDFLEAMLKEIILRKGYLGKREVQTIYFGGGTPSILSIAEIDCLLNAISKNFSVSENVEITFEANPDDLTLAYLKGVKRLGINRLSIGIQSFEDKVLTFMNRRHTSSEAVSCVKNAQQLGFSNLSLDIIYGIPNTDIPYLKANLAMLCDLAPAHISAYHLTIEQGTPFAYLQKKGKLYEIADENSERQYQFLVNFLADRGYEQYEVSNFCKGGIISQHNTNYWRQQPYLGVGPSAHSYNIDSRQWNISNIRKYITSIRKGEIPFEKEILQMKDKYNDYIMTALRTKWGIDLNYIQQNFGMKRREETFAIYQENCSHLDLLGTMIVLKKEAFLRSDYLIAKFFVI